MGTCCIVHMSLQLTNNDLEMYESIKSVFLCNLALMCINLMLQIQGDVSN